MFKCDNCGTDLESFALKESPLIIDGVKYLVEYFECPCCNKSYIVSISVGEFKKRWMELIDAKQELKEVLHSCPSETKQIIKARDKVETLINDIKHMARKGQKLMGILNIK